MIYAVACGQPYKAVKIGYCADNLLRTRLSALQTGNPETLYLIASCPGDRSKEYDLQKDIKDFRIRGEWYRVCPSVMKVVSDIGLIEPPVFFDKREKFVKSDETFTHKYIDKVVKDGITTYRYENRKVEDPYSSVRKLTPSQFEEILKMRSEKMSLRAIGKHFGVTGQTIANYLRRTA